MGLDSSLADEEPVGDLASGKAVEHEARHILFTAAQAGQPQRQRSVWLLSVWRLLEPPGEHDVSLEPRPNMVRRSSTSRCDRVAAQPDPNPGCSDSDHANNENFNPRPGRKLQSVEEQEVCQRQRHHDGEWATPKQRAGENKHRRNQCCRHSAVDAHGNIGQREHRNATRADSEGAPSPPTVVVVPSDLHSPYRMAVSHRSSLPRREADDSTRDVALSDDLRSKTGPWPPPAAPSG